MASNFASRFAPNLALPPMGGDGGGMSGPDQPYDSSGTPLPYLQNQGGPRQYFGTPATSQPAPAAPPIDNSGTPMPYLQNQGSPRQYFGTPGSDGLRGLSSDGLRGPTQPDPDVPPTQNILGGTPGGTRYQAGTPLPVPAWDPRVLENRIIEGIHTGHINPVTPDATGPGGDVSRQQGRTLEDLLSHFNFQFPNMPSISSGQRTTKSVSHDYLSNANTVGEYPTFTSDSGLAEFNRRMNLNLGPQIRSQAAQANLVRGGYTTNPVSWHTVGRAADIHPRDIGGLTGQAAVNEVRRRLVAAGYQQMQVIWESGRGRNQGTGAHVHIEPPGTPQ